MQGIHHVSMKCRNAEEYAKVREFYRDVLGLSIMKECENCTLFDTGSGIVEIFRNKTGKPDKGILAHFAFAAENVDACADAVRKAGYEIFIEPKDTEIGGDPAFPARIAFCKGPLGEEIEFFCQRW